jgi:hypothetical protein
MMTQFGLPVVKYKHASWLKVIRLQIWRRQPKFKIEKFHLTININLAFYSPASLPRHSA